MGYPKKWRTFLVSDKRLTGDGVKWTAKTKKSSALAGVSIEPGHRGYPCPLPCLCPCLCRCLCLSWPVPALSGRYTGKGSGSHWFSFLKRPQNINTWTCIGVAFSWPGKNRPGVMALTVSGREVRAMSGCPGAWWEKQRDGGNPIEHGQASTHVPNFLRLLILATPAPCLCAQCQRITFYGWTDDYPCLWTGQYPCLWTSLM
jgi:hypothetical protein